MGRSQEGQEYLEVENFWNKCPLWPLAYERWFAKRWLVLVLLPYAVIGLYTIHAIRRGSHPFALGVGYLISLGLGLLASGLFFERWEQTLRTALGSLHRRGCAGRTTPTQYLRFSEVVARRFGSRWRLVPILTCVAFSAVVNWKVGIQILVQRQYMVVAMIMVVALGAWSYAVGAVIWAFATATWILWRLPEAVELRIQLGHPDRCCGLKLLGDCALKMTYPLLVGCVLLTVWSMRGLIPLLSYGSNEVVRKEWIEVLLLATKAAGCGCIALTTVVLVGSLWKIHSTMHSFRLTYEEQYAALRDAQMRSCLAIAGTADNGLSKPATERLALLDKLSPDAAGLTDWPLDGSMMTRYAATPVLALLSSFRKEILELLQGALRQEAYCGVVQVRLHHKVFKAKAIRSGNRTSPSARRVAPPSRDRVAQAGSAAG
jgi:hypothetical protein